MSSTLIRLIEPSDGAVLAGLLARDRQAYARWLPARPVGFYTPEGQAQVIESLLAFHDQGLAWPGVVVSDGAVVGQVTISSILRGPFQKGSSATGSLRSTMASVTRAVPSASHCGSPRTS